MPRELHAFRLERALNDTLHSAHEYRDQLKTFMTGSTDAIAQVQEGILVDANPSWLELFGHDGRRGLVGQPLMDFFERRSHAALKGALVACLQGRWSDHSLQRRRRRLPTADAAAGTRARRSASSTASPACALMRADASSATSRRSTSDSSPKRVRRDPATGLLQRAASSSSHARSAARRRQGRRARTSSHIEPDKFAALERELGVARSEDSWSSSASCCARSCSRRTSPAASAARGFMRAARARQRRATSRPGPSACCSRSPSTYSTIGATDRCRPPAASACGAARTATRTLDAAARRRDRRRPRGRDSAAATSCLPARPRRRRHARRRPTTRSGSSTSRRR